MATAQTPTAPTSTLKAYQDKINAQMDEAKAKLQQLEAKAKEKGAQAEITAVNDLKTAKASIDQKMHDLKTTHESHVAHAKANIDADVAAFRASVNDFAAKFKAPSAKK